MTPKTPLLAAALAALLCAPAFAQQPPAKPPAQKPSQREIWNAPAEPFHLIDNVYSVGPAGLASYLFKTQEGLIVLDAALTESVPQIEANIQKLGFKLSDVKIILNSHAHFDHSGGLAQLKKDTGAANRITPPLQYPGIVEDYRKTFARSKAMKVDIFLAPHPEFFDMAGKRAKMKDGAPHPFINPGEFKPFIEKLEAAFEKALAGSGQTPRPHGSKP